jgi:hypothetical protein
VVETLEGKSLLETPRSGLEDNIKMDRQKIGFEGMDWIDMVQDRER